MLSPDGPAEKLSDAEKLARLRAGLAKAGVDGFVVPLTDEHQSEYVPPYAQRLAWLTGFTGSAGSAIILADRAGFFTDGRYVLQAEAQVDGTLYQRVITSQTPLIEWLEANAPDGCRLGFDAMLHTEPGLAALKAAMAACGGDLVAVADNPIDAIWADQPSHPTAPAVVHPIEWAGRSSADKRAELAQMLGDKRCAAAILTQLDSIAWLFNIRGCDVDCTPVVKAFAILYDDGRAMLFIDDDKLDATVRAHLGHGVRIEPPAMFLDCVAALHGRVWVDPATASQRIIDRLEAGAAELYRARDICALPKAIKNETEIAGARAAHRRDGVAMTRFLAWFDRTVDAGGLDELSVAETLTRFRREQDLFRDLSFFPIAGSGPHGAIIHYRVTAETSRAVDRDSVFLIDSGGQYADGTTDVTRVMPVGTPPPEICENYTRVLKGHIALATAIFPEGTQGSQLDAFARRPLWEAGLDYDHGTGHGVGSYLSVHEGPGRIAKVGGDAGIEAGMIFSNEPGYYKPGAYGIRLENLVLVVPVDTAVPRGDTRMMLGFEDLTRAPFDRRLIITDRLSEGERAWIDTYHARVWADLSPMLDGDDRAFLERLTARL